MPHNVYMRVLYIIRDYDRMKAEQNEVIFATPERYMGAKRNGHGDPTANKAIKIANMSRETDAIERALAHIPEEYRDGIWRNIIHREIYPYCAHPNTWNEWKRRFCYFTAGFLGLV